MSRFASIACMLALLLVCSGVMVAQNVDDVYWLTYYDNNYHDGHFPLDSGTIRVINPGLTGSPRSADMGTLCANIYVFDDTQEMIECCSCPLTANGLLTISVNDLTENPLTVTPFRGVIKVVSSSPSPTCDATKLAVAISVPAPDPTPDLRAFATHLQNASFGAVNISGYQAGVGLTNGVFVVTEEEFAAAPLSLIEQADLGTICSFVRYLGTGRGRCDDECDEPVGGD